MERTQVIGIKKLVTEPMNMTEPTQSTRLSCSVNRLGLKLSLRKRGTKMKAMPMKGRLIQKIHLYRMVSIPPSIAHQLLNIPTIHFVQRPLR